MALIIMTGVAGTGKTLYAIQKYIIPELKKGGKVFTNIDGIDINKLSIVFELDLFDLENQLIKLEKPEYFYKELEKNSMCVLDEAQNVFGNRDWQNAANCECNKYLMEHRHYGHRLIFITPHIESLDAGIRRVCEFTYKHKSFSALGNAKTVTCHVFDQANIYKDSVQRFQWKHDHKVYECYKSYFEKGTTEKKVRVHPLRDIKLYALVLFIVIAILLAVRNGKIFVNHMKNNTVEEINRRRDGKAKEKVDPKNEVKYERQNVILINDSLVYGSGYRRVIK